MEPVSHEVLVVLGVAAFKAAIVHVVSHLCFQTATGYDTFLLFFPFVLLERKQVEVKYRLPFKNACGTVAHVTGPSRNVTYKWVMKSIILRKKMSTLRKHLEQLSCKKRSHKTLVFAHVNVVVL